MSRSLALACALVTSMGCVASFDAELGEQEQGIIGGSQTTVGEYSGVVALLIAPAELCTGTLIHPEWVLTAAHCLVGKTAQDVQVLFDKVDIHVTGGVSVQVASVVLHPAYLATQYGSNDVALVKLAAAQPSRVRHAIYRLPLAPDTAVIQVGFGALAAPVLGSGIQRRLMTKTASCNSVGASGVDTSKAVCFNADDGNGTCFGDSGGPTFVRDGDQLAVAAVTSFGANDLCTGYDVATQVTSTLAFLDAYVPKFTPVPTSGDGPTTDEQLSGGCAVGDAAPSLWLFALLLGLRRRPAGARRA